MSVYKNEYKKMQQWSMNEQVGGYRVVDEWTGSGYLGKTIIKWTGSEYLGKSIIKQTGSGYLDKRIINWTGSGYVDKTIIKWTGRLMRDLSWACSQSMSGRVRMERE